MVVTPDRSQLSDLWCFALFGIGGPVTTFVLFVSSFGAFYWFGHLVGLAASQLAGMRIRIDTGCGVANLAVFCFIYTFLDYWCHRICHSGAFWQLHRLHHAATAMNPLVQYRNHPGQRAFEMLFFGWPAGLVSVPGRYVALIGAIMTVYHVLIHADVGWRWGWFGRWVINPPAAHRLHHSADPAHYGKNLSVLVLWDRVFGTWQDPVAPVTAIGLGESRHDQAGLLDDICRGYGLFARDLFGGLFPVRNWY